MEAVQCFAQDTQGTSFRKTDFKFKRFQRGSVQVRASEGFQGGRWFRQPSIESTEGGIYLITYTRQPKIGFSGVRRNQENKL